MKPLKGSLIQTALPPKKRILRLRGDDGREYFSKSSECPNVCDSKNPTWLANELIYYLIAQRAGLQMPRSCMIEFEESTYFGSEYISGRSEISNSKNEKCGNEILYKICRDNPAEAKCVARALLLDLALLNSDRKPWNILIDSNASTNRLYFFDHDKALLGDGKDNGDLWRIRSDYNPVEKWPDYLKCSGANLEVASRLSDQDISGIFNSLKLARGTFDDVRSSCPPEWLPPSLMEELLKFLEKWWSLLQKEFHENPWRFRTVLGADQNTIRTR